MTVQEAVSRYFFGACTSFAVQYESALSMYQMDCFVPFITTSINFGRVIKIKNYKLMMCIQ